VRHADESANVWTGEFIIEFRDAEGRLLPIEHSVREAPTYHYAHYRPPRQSLLMTVTVIWHRPTDFNHQYQPWINQTIASPFTIHVKDNKYT
jgi:hypothetical protein